MSEWTVDFESTALAGLGYLGLHPQLGDGTFSGFDFGLDRPVSDP